MRIPHAFIFALTSSLILGCAARPVRTTVFADPPVMTTDTVRESQPNDYLRVIYVPQGVAVTSLARAGALRAFATATALYEPPLQVRDFPSYSGLTNNDRQVLIAMRCRPPQPQKVDAVLATWPNLFAAVQRDVALPAGICSEASSDTATKVTCFARAFSDPPATAVPTTLAKTFDYAAELYAPGHEAEARWLQDKYGVFPAYSGTGYSVKDSYYLDKDPMSVNQILVKSVSSEYILKNVSLAEAGCRCISVAPYAGRGEDRLDPDFVEKAGGLGACRSVDRLPGNGHK